MQKQSCYTIGAACALALFLMLGAGESPAYAAASQTAGGAAVLTLSAAERKAQGVVVDRAGPHALDDTVTAPGEVRMDAYRSAQVTPRIDAQVIARHARMGDEVKAGQPLVTLSSVAMAQAQGGLIEADREWTRVRRLGRQVVSAKRYVAAQVARQRAYATVLAYGMTETQIRKLLSDDDASHATGRFDLLSPRAGTVISDDFVIGEVVKPGRVLFEVSDESRLWVEAQLRPEQAAGIAVGAPARVGVDGSGWLQGRVVQLHHRLDKTTRTRGVRIAVDNRGDALHAGEYVDVRLTASSRRADVAVPASAVIILDNRPTVFLARGGEFRAEAVVTGATQGGWTEIKSGLAAGDAVVAQGAFYLKSLLLKSQIGDED